MKQAVFIYDNFSETRHNAQGLLLSDVLKCLGMQTEDGVIIAVTILFRRRA
jgi:hypothetical protein